MENEPKHKPNKGAAILKASAGNSPSAQEKSSMPNKTEVLPSGAVAEYLPFKGKNVMAAQRLANGDQSLVLPALMSSATLYNGQPFVMEDVSEMDGRDVLHLMAYYQGLF